MRIAALEIATLQGVVRQNSDQVDRLVGNVSQCLEEARSLADLQTPYSKHDAVALDGVEFDRDLI